VSLFGDSVESHHHRLAARQPKKITRQQWADSIDEWTNLPRLNQFGEEVQLISIQTNA
jgi:hypothetical protein